MRAVPADPLERHIEGVGRRHHRVRVPAHGAGAKLRPVVKADDGVGNGIRERTCLEHRGRAGQRFLGGLEDEHHAAGDVVAHPGQHGSDAEDDCRMGVVPAGVHLARNLRRKRQAGRLVDRQRVHVGTDRDRRSRLAALQ